MTWTTAGIKRRLGLDSDSTRESSAPVILSSAASDPKSGMIVSVSTETTLDENGAPRDITLSYLRHLPYGTTLEDKKIRIRLAPGAGGDDVEPQALWVQSRCVFDREKGDHMDDPAAQGKVNGVIEAVSRVNRMLRNHEPIENIARVILKDARLGEITGENVAFRGLEREGGFSPVYLTGQFQKAANDDMPPFYFQLKDAAQLKMMLGFRRNTLDPSMDHAGAREAYAADPDSGVGYLASVKVKESQRKFTMAIHVDPEEVPDGVDPKALPNLVKLEFTKRKKGFELSSAQFDGRRIDVSDTKTVLALVGFAQDANADFAKRRYPDFMGHVAKHGLLERLSQLPPPPSQEAGGEMVYVSQYGSGVSKKIENFCDQIGINAYVMHRMTRKDGSISEIGVQVDAAFASGGPDSAYDGAIADPFVFRKDTKVICITHKHYDHKGGLKYLGMIGQDGLLRDKIIVCEERDKYFIESDLACIPAKNRPKIVALAKEGAMPVLDDDGNVRFWIQYCPLATEHSARCTPYKITGCVNDDHYNGSLLVYGDSRGLREDKVSFFQREGTMRLVEQAAAQGYTVTPEKIDKPTTVVLHDVTAVSKQGKSEDYDEVRDNLRDIIDMFPGMNVLPVPISTNDMEYMAFLDAAATGKYPRNVTAVGANAEKQLTAANIFGVDPYLKLSEKRIGIYEDGKPNPVIPASVRQAYEAYLRDLQEVKDKLGVDDVAVLDGENRLVFDRAEKRLMTQHMADYVDEYVESPPSQHFASVSQHMLDRLMCEGAVTFKDDANGFLMWKSIEVGRDFAPVRATRGSEKAKDFRDDPGALMIFTTGTQGNAEEKFSTVQKLSSYFSLLDADERVRGTGYKIDLENSVLVIPQSAIPGNEDSQRRMVTALAKTRNTTVIVAFEGGFTIHNPKHMRDDLKEQLYQMGAPAHPDGYGNLTVYNKSIHFNGHGKQQDMEKLALSVDADLHAAHHIPSSAAVVDFNALMDRNNLPRAAEEPDDFKLMRVDAHQKEAQEKFKCIGRINPSIVAVREVRKYGQQYGGTLQWQRMTLLERQGHHRADGLQAATPGDSVFVAETPRAAWARVSNPRATHKTLVHGRRNRMMGPSDDSRRPPQQPRSKALLRGVKPKKAA